MLQRCHAPLLCVLSLLPVISPAAEPAEELTPVVVSATRSEERDVKTPANIAVIDRTEIETSGAANRADLLRGHAGIQISDLFGDGSRPTVSMRGFGGNAQANTLILVDGRRLNNADLGNPDLNSIPLEDIERIEIVEGSGGTLFGDQAVAGVINIITRAPEKLRARAVVQAGSYDHHDESLTVENRHSNGFGYRFSGVKRDTDNYRRSNGSDFDSLSDRDIGTSLVLGKYLSPRLYLSYGVGLFEPGQVITLRYRLGQRWNLEVQNATDFSRATLNYRLER